MTVVGDAGVGKSRLAAEFLASIDGDGRPRPLPAVRRRDHVLAGRRGAEAARRAAGRRGGCGGIRSLLGESEAPTSSEEIAWAFRKTLEHAAAERPLVVVFDDIQWGEETFLDLIEHVALLSTARRSCCSAWLGPSSPSAARPGR